MTIPLSTILNIETPSNYKVHLACWNGSSQPLNVFVRDRDEWDNWNRWRSTRDEFNRDYILSLAHFYHETNVWLFAGIYKVIERRTVKRDFSYKIERISEHIELIGRLKIYLPRPGRIRSVKLENYYQHMFVSELLKETYTGERFTGYEDVSCDFGMLKTVFRTSRADWKAALEHIKGVYLITDKSNGKKYVGSAYGEYGIWSRWACYMNTGHGWNDELTQLIDQAGIDYARNNFRISLLESRPMRTEDKFVIARETFWKEALLSRIPFGYNKN